MLRRLKSSMRRIMLTSYVTSSAHHPQLSSGNIKRRESSLRLMVRLAVPQADLFQSLFHSPNVILIFHYLHASPILTFIFPVKIVCELSQHCDNENSKNEAPVFLLRELEYSKFYAVFICTVLFVDSSLILHETILNSKGSSLRDRWKKR